MSSIPRKVRLAERNDLNPRSENPFDDPVILLNKVIQILILTDLDFLTGFFDKRFDGGRIGAALINGDFFRKTVSAVSGKLMV